MQAMKIVAFTLAICIRVPVLFRYGLRTDLRKRRGKMKGIGAITLLNSFGSHFVNLLIMKSEKGTQM